MSSRTSDPAGTIVLDSEGLAKAVGRDQGVMDWLAQASADELRVIVSAATLVEVMHPGMRRAAFDWTLSHLAVEPVSEAIARSAAALLAKTGMHGHENAIDAMVAATALAASSPVTVLTSDPGDLTRLCGDRAAVIKV